MKNEFRHDNSASFEIALENFDTELSTILDRLLAPSTRNREVHFTFTGEKAEKIYFLEK